jgi:hypothetical protein
MKKSIIVLVLAAYSHVTIAQSSETVSGSLPDSLISVKLASLEDRLSQNEEDVLLLKAENINLKKELSLLKSQRVKPATQRRFNVSRKGSKQVTVD